MNLEEVIEKYYTTHNYNCAETLVHAANEYYDLHLHEEDMKMMAGFGGGMFIGSTCGALIGSIAALSSYIVETKAHETEQIRTVMQRCCKNFKEVLGATDCAHVKAVHHDPIKKCLPTCLLAGKALEKTILEISQ